MSVSVEEPAIKNELNEKNEEPVTDQGSSSHEPIDILGNGKVVKTILTSGSGDFPRTGSRVKVHYTGTLEDGTKFDSSRDRNQPFEFELGAMRVIKGWEVCVASMKPGEKCRVVLQPDFAYGEHGSPPTIPANAVLVFEIELLSFDNRKEKWAMTCDEKLTAAAENKQEGTSYLKEGKLSQSAVAYSEAVNLMEKLEDWPETQVQQATELFISCNLNLALVQSKLRNWLEVILAASSVLAQQPSNVKALYRRALARAELDEFDSAEADLKKAMEADPENTELKRALITVKQKRREVDIKVKKLYQRMF